MNESDENIRPEDRIHQLETRMRHLSNELRLTREEYENTSTAYFELYSRMEEKVEERSQQLIELQKVLEAKGRELEIMLDQSPGIVFYKDAQQRYIRVNKKFAELIGVPIVKVLGRTFTELFPELSASILADDSYVLQTGHPILNQERVLELPGGPLPLLVNKAAHKDIDGNVVGIIGFALDLTDQKRAEQEKEELQGQLLQAQKMEAIGTLAGGIAHDFNNILAVIIGYTELLQYELQHLDIPDEHSCSSYLETIIDASLRAKGVNSQMLAFSRQGEYEPTVLRIEEIIGETIAFLKETADRRVTLSTEIAPGSHTIFADRNQMHQILMNLCTNALHAMPEGGTLGISADNAVLDEDFVERHNPEAAPGAYLELTVADTGCGMDPETLQHVFEPFFTTKGVGEGTGLGMATVYGIVRSHRGLVDVESNVAKGTEVTVYIPSYQGSQVAKGEETATGMISGTERILVVDDEEMLRGLMEKALLNQGYSVLTAKDGDEGLEVFRAEYQAIDLVLLDLAMPKKTGTQVLAEMRQLDPQVKLVVVSGHIQLAEQAGLLSQGTKILQKPFKIRELAAAVRSALDGI